MSQQPEIRGEKSVTRYMMYRELERVDHPGWTDGQLVNQVMINMALDPEYYTPYDEAYEQIKAYKYAKHVMARSRGKLVGDTCRTCRLRIDALDGRQSFCGLGGSP